MAFAWTRIVSSVCVEQLMKVTALYVMILSLLNIIHLHLSIQL